MFSVSTTGVGDRGKVPRRFEVFQNYPNPFNASTRITYYLPTDGEVQVNVYDATGRFVKSLVEIVQTAGEHSISWDGTNYEGKSVASGLYFYQVKYGESNVVKRMTLVK